MPNIIHKPSWALSEAHATPEDAFFNRRDLIKGFGLAGLGIAAAAALQPGRARADSDPTADLYPAERNTAFTLDRDLTPEDVNSTYNNFYEFGSHKQIWKAAQALKTSPWDIEIDGLVEEPFTIGFEDLACRVSLEERLYRHRCVEAWSMTIPWTGFALKDLVAMAKPLSSAKYIRFETFLDPQMAAGQKQRWYPWPYVEGVTIDEAANDLAFMVTGAYGKPLAKQFGAPLRLALPWKYGFKSIKSIRRISFTDTRPVSFWEEVLPEEYGFWANVNPGVPHARWSQHQERILHTGLYMNTLMFNGYGEQVAHLYKGMEREKLYM
ncbi:protein-methionine-sulfoxide reductase catalytic subunit MsrP [Hoeflea prorocentri]|uniref:Protein-methionine-sulfoxide reductase catalytic subunit MsrP n=1 Tax=Hoeflea prorocentri TaxID=1922333 RepID=A0A9X3UFH2_9HYPH|nr:protein-methionine-sulfoxide reductase catalytic subunit MsrP [Hoeflea prorocentri]MCY6379580.1 protein-methionine-sulfoxide reductase catalytic subunit MsrP [Hoeflea prorocentri]MDA5397380.1 protein-methionine-sulfoxide reductase catalytic subunit MsrP [Hoeflea prorocentri]